METEYEEEEEGGEIVKKEQSNRDDRSDTNSLADSEGSVSAKRGKYTEGLPDVTTLLVEYSTRNTPDALTLDRKSPEEKEQRRQMCTFIHFGGINLDTCKPDSFTELKWAPRRYCAKQRFDKAEAYQVLYRDMENQLLKAAAQITVYSIIFFTKYPGSSHFLAIIGSGPFWHYTIIRREHMPWSEPGSEQYISGKEKDAREERFFGLFGTVFFEIGTERSDMEWDKIRHVYFMGHPGELGSRPKDSSSSVGFVADPQPRRVTRASRK
ncbi:hypothetical protein GYMLUDRAFT_46573 [Collybiopsis luxurians FD-317 M1]|uniref:Uncharacterized protein n=1 Tax=Collybiopsis luxurians FD-317 M1 TaxID=944289 RepID=A0A0D0CPM2_9AGAR|nr:hypothetical protein GYMLUDRAFT_46573 [Collybiopsis luxurians FD-317 M1]